MIVDLHCHYPMHLPETHRKSSPGHHDPLADLVRGMAFGAANALLNGKFVVSVDSLHAGEVKVILSMLYQPFDEIDLSLPYAAKPKGAYYDDLIRLMDAVEADIAARPTAAIARNQAELDQAQAAGQVALIHAVEGGFHIGSTESEVRTRVAELAARGVAYITVAHLFFRQVATNAPAVTIVPDALYRKACPQPPTGLEPLGAILIDEMITQKILVDLSHMSYIAIAKTLAQLDALDPSGTAIPVMATHAACALTADAPEYNIRPEHIKAVHQRGGVIGLIACEHWMAAGRHKPDNFDETMDLLFEHIKVIYDATGSYDAVAIGSDMDGFIRPSLKGLDTPEDLNSVKHRLIARYGHDVADQMCYGNALRVLRWWGS